MNRAVLLWTQAAQGGNRESQWHLGQAFEDGKGVERSLAQAYAWYRCAAAGLPAPAADDLDAAEQLAKRYVASYSKAGAN